MKNKIFKILSVVFLMVLLCGCDKWDDYKNFNCSYTGSLPLNNGSTLTSYSARKTDSFFHTAYNTSIDSCKGDNMNSTSSGCGLVMSSDDNSASNITVYNTTFKYDKGDLKGMGEHFENTAECPSTIYFKTASGGYKVVDSCNENKNNCYTMSRNDDASSSYKDDNYINDHECSYDYDDISFKITMHGIENSYVTNANSRKNATKDYLNGHFIVKYKLAEDGVWRSVPAAGSDFVESTEKWPMGVQIFPNIDGTFFKDSIVENNPVCLPLAYTLKFDSSVYVIQLTRATCSELRDLYNNQGDGTTSNAFEETFYACQDKSGTKKCYDRKTGNAINCDSAFKEEDILEKEKDASGNEIPQKTCNYSLNKGDNSFNMIYKLYPKEGYVGVGESADALAKQECKGRIGRLRFDKGNTSANLDSSVDHYEGTDGYTYITEESVLKQFCDVYKETEKEANCPAYLDCWCKEDKYCYFGDEAKSSKGTCGIIKGNDGEEIEDAEEYFQDLSLEIEGLDISNEHMTCEELLRGNLVKVVRMFMNGIRIVGAIICIVKAMGAIMPAVTSHDADALKKAGKTCAILAIILCVIGLFPTLVKLIGKIGGFDLSCL